MSGRLNVQKCLDDAVAAGRITEATARQARGKVEELLGKGLTEAEAVAKAAGELAAEAAARRAQTARRIVMAAQNKALTEAHPDGTLRGVMAIFARDVMGRAGYSNVEGRTLAVTAEAHARLTDLLDRYRPRKLGWSQDTAALRRFVEALYGQGNDAEARALAKAWTETTDHLVARFNRAGGNLANLSAWRLPQLWDRARVKAAGEGGFRAFMQDELARGGLRILDHDTGKPLAAADATRVIDEAWARISTNGVSDLVPGQPGGRGALANSRTMHRAFEWTDAAAWFRFNDRFGQQDAGIFDSLTGHVDGLARDVALLEILGPNPAWMARYLLDLARKSGASEAGLALAENLWKHVSGAVDQPVSEFLANLGRGVRSWLTSAQLGAAMLSSTTDFWTLSQTASFNGLASTQIMRRYLALLNPADDADRRRAVTLGLIAESWTVRALGAMRHQAEAVGRDLPGRIANTVLAASGMTAHTQAARHAFGMEFSAHLAERAGRGFDQLEPELRATMARYGVRPADWDAIRTRGVWEDEGAAFILPEQVVRPDAPADAALLRARTEAAARYLDLVNGEARFAVPEPGALDRAILLGGSRPGTIGGEFRRAFAQYKSFSVTMMTRHLARGLDEVSRGDGGRYLAGMAVGLTVAGAFAMQLKEVGKGRDPRAMDSAAFWGAAFAQGGGAGILGDFLYSGLSRGGRDFFMTAIGGPTMGLADDLVRLTAGNVLPQFATDEASNFGREFARFVQVNTPGTSLWYSRLAMDRLMWERLQELLDPHAARRWRQMERRAMREHEQEFWWRPGETAPERAPAVFR